MLELNDVHAGYGGGEVLAGLSFKVGAGEIVSLLGRNGMGKTTALRCIMGLLRPGKGSIRFQGQEISGRETYKISRGGIAYVPQGREIFSVLTVQENLLLAAPRGGSLDRAYDLFPALRAKAGDAGGSLSGGQQQQLAIARALLTQPRLLLLDEPSEGIQPSIVADIADIVKEIARSHGISILLVEQNTALALKTADRALFIEGGRIRGDYATQDVSRDVLHEYMAL